MPQGSFIIGTVFIAFLVFITARNELLTYIDLIIPGRNPTDATGGTGTGSVSAGQTNSAGTVTTGPTNLPNSAPFPNQSPDSVPNLLGVGSNFSGG